MDAQETEDRLVALEALTTELIRALHRAGVLREAQVGALLDRVEELMTGQPGATFAAQQLAAAADPQGPGAEIGEVPPEAALCASFRRILYGREAADARP
ncbi:hypothetical protein [Methylobacterium platani]|uniref:Uncharacterized protein n=2 Tax=Methylobacterium platani TaxID=427683 RepID=A0A179SJZ9_9HYPH|nr:hypothetical protein [Methylobacterium platani]KMO21145.1 hypothetical protein SQ03_04090 [Methylobacterium platani JCM 14648]OAS26893.1 hypothetical protein A5481_03890 [Methylobacterium platani]